MGKKTIALITAMIVMMSMAAVSFADGGHDEYVRSGTLTVYKNYFVERNDRFLEGAPVEYGDTVYYNIYDAADYHDDSSGEPFGGDRVAGKKFMEKVKIKTDFEMGGEIVEKVELVKMTADLGNYDPEYPGEKTEYFIAVKLADKATTADADVVGTFEIDRKAIKGKDVGFDFDIPKVDGMKVDFEFPVFYLRNWNDFAEDFLVEDEVNLKYNEMYALKFDSDEEVELSFGGKDGRFGDEPNEGTFTVDASGQGKVFIKWDTEPDEALAAANPGVDMHFVNFNDVKFNRTGEFVYEMENGVAAYMIHDGVITEMADCYDASEGAFVFRTNVLCNYVFADEELFISTPEDFDYDIRYDHVVITGYHGEGGRVKIPSHIKGKPVTKIEHSVFSNNENITEVNTGNITEIDEATFNRCSRLEKVIMPKVTAIDKYVFVRCTSLKEVEAPMLKTIGNESFAGCSSLESINLMDVNEIGKLAFEECSSLKSVYAPNVKHVEYSAFLDCINLEEAIFPNAEVVGGAAFKGCPNLKRASFASDAYIVSTAFDAGAAVTVS